MRNGTAWDRIFDIDDAWEDLVEETNMHGREFPPLRTKQWRQARNTRMAKIREEIGKGIYWKPAVLIAEGILLGRPEYGEANITGVGNRVDEMCMFGRPITTEVRIV